MRIELNNFNQIYGNIYYLWFIFVHLEKFVIMNGIFNKFKLNI